MMKAGAEELNSLRQQNYLLQSKVHKHISAFIPYIWKICKMAHSYLGTARVRLVFFLSQQLRSAEEASQKKRWVEAADVAADEKFQQIDKEIKEQEALIKGYQQVSYPEL